MKIISIYIIIFTATILGLSYTGCTPNSSKGKEKKPQILSVTNNPQKYFLEAIVGDKFSINCLIPSGANPENMDLSPSQLLTLSKSVAYFKIGFLEMEKALVDKVTENNKEIVVFECWHGIEILKDEHADEDHIGHSHADGDPHIWSSPKTAKIIAENMYEGMLSLDADNKEYYTTNYNKLMTRIDSTDSVIKSYLDKSPNKSFIIFHPALSYFAQEYGLHQLAIEHEGKSPTPSQMKALIDHARADNIKVVFIQQEYDAKNAETVAKTIGAKAVVVDLLSYSWDEEMIKIAKAIASANG